MDIEVKDWLESLADLVERRGVDDARHILERTLDGARERGIFPEVSGNTPYVNTIGPDAQPEYPGDMDIERAIEGLVRWNAMAMVVRANRDFPGIGGHISTYASLATLVEVGFNHFFRAQTETTSGDQVFFQGHASPGIYARAFVEGRMDASQLEHFRRESGPERGLSSYPHPRLMPEFWQFPTVSMGLGPILAIYQARFNRYLADRGLHRSDSRVWCFLGDGECDEPETIGSIGLAGRQELGNLIFVVNCNLQRLDGPVRGNGKIIQELERLFAGANWNVIKVVWGGSWDDLLARDHSGALLDRMNRAVDGDFQKYSTSGGSYMREHFFGASAELAAMVESMSDDDIEALQRGGHDPCKVYAAYQAAVQQLDRPTVILAKTVKGYGLGPAGAGLNATHQQKKLDEEQLIAFRDRFGVPLSDEQAARAEFVQPAADSEIMMYLHQCRRKLGGYVPARVANSRPLAAPSLSDMAEMLEASEDRPVATTMAFVRLLSKLMDADEIGPRVVPIISDEARTFGLDALFAKRGIYSHRGQSYEPVDADSLLHYREAVDGQILQEGITEAGCMSSFVAAGTSYSTHGLHMLPFFMFYSMFGFQRVGDLIWAAADARARGFLLGCTAGRTTLSGEGLQHQDGHSHLAASAVPSVAAYDPAFAYEVAVIVQHGLEQMLQHDRDDLYYLTLYNEQYPMPAMPEGAADGIIRGLYSVAQAPDSGSPVQLVASGPIVCEALAAQKILAEQFDVAAQVWSATSFSQLQRDALAVERWNRLHPDDQPQLSHLDQTLRTSEGPIVAATDQVVAVPYLVAPWLDGRMVALGTDGFGRSDTREALRSFFEIDAAHIVLAALRALDCGSRVVERAMETLAIDRRASDPSMRSVR